MARPSLVILTLLVAAPLIAQKTSLMNNEDLRSFVSKLRQDSQSWANTLSSIDVSSVSKGTDPKTKVIETKQRSCLDAINNLQKEMSALEKQNLFRNQLTVLNELTSVADCLSSFQEGLPFENAIGPGLTQNVSKYEKWEKWQNDLVHAFQGAAADKTKMYEHMVALASIVDSKVDAGAVTKSDSKLPSNSQ
jgi:hypothetical protein